MAEGRILSIESLGLVDGPGIRTVVFMQGCPLRCRFCHNPDSWEFGAGQSIDADELYNRILRFRPYFERSGGGVTFSGGEPLMQKDFLLYLLKKLKAAGVHTCIDTSGVGMGDYEEILKYTDLVLYDIKAMDAESYREICGGNISVTEKFMRALAKSGVETVVRQVVVPGINDTDEYMQRLKNYIKENIPGATKVELLPYHLMGSHKYKKLGITESLVGVPAMDRDVTEQFYEKYFKEI